jgi:SynChlorMet cassette protein ScmD
VNNDERPIRNPFVVLREEFDDWAILFNPDTGRGFGLSPTGVYVWKLLDGTRSLEDLRTGAGTDVSDATDEAFGQVATFVGELIRHDLASYAGEPSRDALGACQPFQDDCTNDLDFILMKIIDDPPKLIDFTKTEAAHGLSCTPTGYYNDGSCEDGACAGQFCLSGTAAGVRCCTGASPGNASNCLPGDCPSRCVNCYAGGGACNSMGLHAGYGNQCETGDAASPCGTGNSPS